MARIEADELLRLYANGERNFSGLEIAGSDELAGANLSDIDLSNSMLAEMCLDNINLSRANPQNAHFGLSSFYCAKLQDADLSGASLSLADFVSTDLTNARLVEAYIVGTSFVSANLTGVDFTRATIGESGIYMKESILSNTTMPDGEVRNDGV